MTTSVKHFGLGLGPRPGNMSQSNPKTTSLMTSLTKKSAPHNLKFFFECNLLDWLIRLSL